MPVMVSTQPCHISRVLRKGATRTASLSLYSRIHSLPAAEADPVKGQRGRRGWLLSPGQWLHPGLEGKPLILRSLEAQLRNAEIRGSS